MEKDFIPAYPFPPEKKSIVMAWTKEKWKIGLPLPLQRDFRGVSFVQVETQERLCFENRVSIAQVGCSVGQC